MNDLERALSDIADIRNKVAQTRLFRGFGPLVIAATGVLALVLAAAQSAGSVPTLPKMLYAWVILAICSVGLIGCEMWALSKRAHGAVAGTFLWAMIEKFLPAIFAGGAIGWAILSQAPDVSWTLPGLWLILVSLGLFSALSMLPKRLVLVAAWYFLSGVTVFILTASHLNPSPWLMGLPFGVGQLLMAALLQWAPEESFGGSSHG